MSSVCVCVYMCVLCGVEEEEEEEERAVQNQHLGKHSRVQFQPCERYTSQKRPIIFAPYGDFRAEADAAVLLLLPETLLHTLTMFNPACFGNAAQKMPEYTHLNSSIGGTHTFTCTHASARAHRHTRHGSALVWGNLGQRAWCHERIFLRADL